MRALIPPSPPPGSSAGDVDVHAWYGAQWSDTGGVRLNMIASVDGAASIEGRSAGLQTPGDNRVFAALRDLADVIVVGARTARVEGYGPAVPSDRRQQLRRRLGYTRAPRIAVVSDQLDLDLTSDLFAHCPEDLRTLVITGQQDDPTKVEALGRRVELITTSGPAVDMPGVDLPAAMRVLRERGMPRILCEGGPTLLSSMARSGAADELCMTVSPKLAGPGADRIALGAPWQSAPIGMELTHLLEEDGALFARYRMQPPVAAVAFAPR